MSTIAKCPDCQGTKCTALSGNKYRCLYCGSTFTVDAQEPQNAPQPQNAPYQQAVTPQVIYVQQPVYQQPQQPSYAEPQIVGTKNKTTAALLAFFFGCFGVQYFYLGKPGIGIVCLLFCWTFIPCLLALIDFIRFLCMSDRQFDLEYNTVQ